MAKLNNLQQAKNFFQHNPNGKGIVVTRDSEGRKVFNTVKSVAGYKALFLKEKTIGLIFKPKSKTKEVKKGTIKW